MDHSNGKLKELTSIYNVKHEFPCWKDVNRKNYTIHRDN